MVEKSEHISKKDLELILEVNRKSIEIETARADQNEEIIILLNQLISSINKIESRGTNYVSVIEKIKSTTEEHLKFSDNGVKIVEKVKSALEDNTKIMDKLKTQSDDQLKIIDKLDKKTEETSRDIFRLQVLFLSGVFSLIIQIIQIFRH